MLIHLCRRADGRGFSLVELAVCCVLLSFLALFCVGGLQGIFPAARVSRAVREVAALLDWTRWSAVRHGSKFRVSVHPEQGVITVFRETQNEAGEKKLVETRRLSLREVHPGVVFGTANGVVRTSGCKPVDVSGVHLQGQTLRFLPTGTTDRSGSLYLIPEQDVPDRGDRMHAVSVLLTTGRLQTWRYNPLAPSECAQDGAWRPL
jgi:Tfp pilus assembly protein FimT